MKSTDVRNYPTADKTTDFLARFKDSLKDWRILELGPYNGRNTKVIAPHCKQIMAVEARAENCQLVRDLNLKNVRVVLANAADDELLLGLGKFDLVLHSGVLYHLFQPLEHIRFLPEITNRLWLNTHYSKKEGGEIKAEPISEPRAGIHRESKWLGRQQLLNAIQDAGFDYLEIVAECMEPNGPRICLYAEKTSLWRQ